MKNVYISVTIIILIIVPFLSACNIDNHTTVTNGGLPSVTVTGPAGTDNDVLIPIPRGSLPEPTGPEAPDDIVITPGGDAYRANVHQVGVPDKWPSIVSIYKELDGLNIHYRDNIETKAGETRKNIISVYGGESLMDSKLSLYSSTVPDGMKLTDTGGGGRPGMLLTVLAIEISPDVAPGLYAFKIGVEVNGKDYGALPCTINVIE